MVYLKASVVFCGKSAGIRFLSHLRETLCMGSCCVRGNLDLDLDFSLYSLKQCKALLKEESGSPLLGQNDRKTGIARAIYELVSHGIRGPIKKESALVMLGELAALHSDIPSIMLDIFGVLDAETAAGGGGSGADASTEERGAFCYIVKESERFLSEKLLKERLEIDTLQDVGTIKNRSFYTKFIKVKTKL